MWYSLLKKSSLIFFQRQFHLPVRPHDKPMSAPLRYKQVTGTKAFKTKTTRLWESNLWSFSLSVRYWFKAINTIYKQMLFLNSAMRFCTVPNDECITVVLQSQWKTSIQKPDAIVPHVGGLCYTEERLKGCLLNRHIWLKLC